MIYRFALITLVFIIFSCSSPNTPNQPKINPIMQNFMVVDMNQSAIDTNNLVSDIILAIDSVIVKEHFFTNLSSTHNFKLTFYEYIRDSEVFKHYWTIIVFDKQKKIVDSIDQPAFVLYSDLIDFSTARSYCTGVNQNAEVLDNYFGDFVVADFNFDLKDDFAIRNDMGGNGGTFYSYYIQQDKQKFILDTFLTDSMTYFPTQMNKKKKTLVTYVHAGVCGLGEQIYQLDEDKKWKEISHQIIDICNE